jgi:hypothetical protein
METALILQNLNTPVIKITDLSNNNEVECKVTLNDGSDTLPMLAASGTIAGAYMQVYYAKVYLAYTVDLQRFLMEWRREQDQRHLVVTTGGLRCRAPRKSIASELRVSIR